MGLRAHGVADAPSLSPDTSAASWQVNFWGYKCGAPGKRYAPGRPRTYSIGVPFSSFALVPLKNSVERGAALF